jgi:hypothetical protein
MPVVRQVPLRFAATGAPEAAPSGLPALLVVHDSPAPAQEDDGGSVVLAVVTVPA